MTEPTDDEIVALMRDGYNCRYNDEADNIDFARAVLAKWGTPAPVGVEPFGIWHEGETEDESDFYLFKDSGDVACPSCIKLYTADQALVMGRVPLTDAQIKGLIEEDVFFGNCKEIVRAIEAAHGIGIKGGQHGTE